MARPKKASDEVRHSTGIRYSTAEREAVRRSAAALGLSFNEFVRQRSLTGQARPTEYRKGLHPQSISDLNQLGMQAAENAEQAARLGNVAMQIVRAINFDGREIPNDQAWQQLPDLIKANQEEIAKNQDAIRDALAKAVEVYE